MNHVGQGIAILLALTDHSRDVVPRITVILHGLDDFDDRVNISDVLFDVFGFKFVNVLLFLKLSYSLILVSFDLIVLLPSDSLDIFFLLVLVLLVVHVIQTHSLVESRELLARVA